MSTLTLAPPFQLLALCGEVYLLLSAFDVFYLFSCPIALSRTSAAMLDRSGRPRLVPDFRGEGFSLLPLRVLLAVGFS